MMTMKQIRREVKRITKLSFVAERVHCSVGNVSNMLKGKTKFSAPMIKFLEPITKMSWDELYNLSLKEVGKNKAAESKK